LFIEPNLPTYSGSTQCR